MHRNPWWLTPDGSDPRLPARSWSGSSSRPGVTARVLGKPSPDVLPASLRRELQRDLGRRRLARDDIAMVGDDLQADVARRAARRDARDPRADRQDGRGRGRPPRSRGAAAAGPDAIAASLAEVVAALD